MPRQLRVFLCHASQDKPAVWKLRRYLKQHGISPWLDQADLLPGQNWEVEIPKALFNSDVILVCLSKNSVNKEGYVQKEIVFALDKAMEKPEGTIFIVPVKLEECEVPKRLSPYQWVDYFRPDGRKRLLMGLSLRAQDLSEDVSPVILEDTRRKTTVPGPSVLPNIKSIAHDEEKLGRVLDETFDLLLQKQSEHEIAEKAEREKMELARAKQVEKQRLEKQKLEKQKPVVQPAPIIENKTQGMGKSAPKLNVRSLGIGGIIFFCLLLSVFSGYYVNKYVATSQTNITFQPTEMATNKYFSDNFSVNSVEMETSSNRDIGTENGVYFIKTSSFNSWRWGTSKSKLYNVVIDVDVNMNDAPSNGNFGFGVVCRLSENEDSGYIFAIRSDGYFSVREIVRNNTAAIIDWTSSDAIKQGNTNNHIRVTCHGNSLILEVNEKLISSNKVSLDSSQTGSIALAAISLEPFGQAVNAYFDNLVVSQP